MHGQQSIKIGYSPFMVHLTSLHVRREIISVSVLVALGCAKYS
jgi:hypothetical protein